MYDNDTMSNQAKESTESECYTLLILLILMVLNQICMILLQHTIIKCFIHMNQTRIQMFVDELGQNIDIATANINMRCLIILYCFISSATICNDKFSLYSSNQASKARGESRQ